MDLISQLDDYKVLKIILNSKEIWSVLQMLHTCQRIKKIILDNKKIIFQQFLKVDLDLIGSLELYKFANDIDPPSYFRSQSGLWGGFEIETYLVIFQLFQDFEIDLDIFQEVPLTELLWSDDFYPDVIVLDPGYLERINDKSYLEKLKIIGQQYLNGYKVIHDSESLIDQATHMSKSKSKYESHPSFNSQKYQDQLSSPIEVCYESKIQLLDALNLEDKENPLIFVKSQCMGKRTCVRDLITTIISEVQHHCAMWSLTSLSGITYQHLVLNGQPYTYLCVEFDTESG